MAIDNVITITGNVTGDPGLNKIDNGRGASVSNFSLCWNKRFRKPDSDEWETEPHFIDVTCWRDVAENVYDSIRKGDRVTVTGHIEQQTWKDKDTGGNRSKIVLIADDVAVSLRWASVPNIEKNERRQQESRPRGGRAASDGGGSSGGGESRPRGGSSRGRGGDGDPGPREPDFGGGYSDVEEPF